VAAAPFPAVGGSGWEPGVTFAANHFLAVVLLSQHAKRGLDDAASQAENQVERRLLLDVVVGQCAAVFQLLAGEDQTLLVRGDAFLVLDLGLDILYGVAGFDFEGDRLPRQRLHENLHLVFFFS